MSLKDDIDFIFLMLNNEYITMQPSGLKGLYILSLLTFLMVLVMLVMSFTSNIGFSASSGGTKANFFDSQNAMVTGTVTQVKGDVLTVQNKKGIKQDFKASKTLMVMGGTPTAPGQSADLSKIETGKEYLINLIANGDTMEVSSVMSAVSVLPPTTAPVAPTKPASATNSAAPAAPAASAPAAPKP